MGAHKMDIGGKIQTLRKQFGISQEQLAERLGVSRQSVSKWEAGQATPEIEKVLALSEVFGVSTDYLIKNNSEPVTPIDLSTKGKEDNEAIIKTHNKKPKFILWIAGVLVIATAVLLFIIFSGNGFELFGSADFSEDIDAMEVASQSVVMLNCYDKNNDLVATGSGFVAFEDDVIITNYHVIEGAYSLVAYTENDLYFDLYTVLAASKEDDIAILRANANTGLDTLSIDDPYEATKGEKVVAIGSPLGLKNSVSTGVISGISDKDGKEILNFTASISSGSSGGALLNNSGEVIGITYASYTEGQNINFAIPITRAKELWNSYVPGSEISMEELYSENIEVYSVKYVLENREDLYGKYIYVEGDVDYCFEIISPEGNSGFLTMDKYKSHRTSTIITIDEEFFSMTLDEKIENGYYDIYRTYGEALRATIVSDDPFDFKAIYVYSEELVVPGTFVKIYGKLSNIDSKLCLEDVTITY